jgi:hypothetical protein
MILTGCWLHFEPPFREVLRSARVSRAGERVLAIANFSRLCSRSYSLRKACFGATPKPGRQRCATLLQLAEPAQRDGGLRIVDFVAAMEGADPDPLESGAFD